MELYVSWDIEKIVEEISKRIQSIKSIAESRGYTDEDLASAIEELDTSLGYFKSAVHTMQEIDFGGSGLELVSLNLIISTAKAILGFVDHILSEVVKRGQNKEELEQILNEVPKFLTR